MFCSLVQKRAKPKQFPIEIVQNPFVWLVFHMAFTERLLKTCTTPKSPLDQTSQLAQCSQTTAVPLGTTKPIIHLVATPRVVVCYFSEHISTTPLQWLNCFTQLDPKLCIALGNIWHEDNSLAGLSILYWRYSGGHQASNLGLFFHTCLRK